MVKRKSSAERLVSELIRKLERWQAMWWLLLIPVAGGAYAAYKYLNGSGAPLLQSIRRVDANGNPIQVVVPVVGPGNAATANGPTVITNTGSSPTSVTSTTDVQNALCTLGYPCAVDGAFGPITLTALNGWQGASGMPLTSSATPDVMLALGQAIAIIAAPMAAVGQAAQAGAVPAGAPTIASPQDVQHALNLLGASPALVEDGNFGPLSQAALKAFQTTHGLTPDGIPGPQSMTALSIALSPSGSAPVTAAGFGFGFGKDGYGADPYTTGKGSFAGFEATTEKKPFG